MGNGTTIANFLSHSLGANPAISGALSLWLLGIMTYLFRSLPAKLRVFFKTRFTLTLVISTESVANIATAQAFYTWYVHTKYMRRSRTFVLEATHQDRQLARTGEPKGNRLLGPGLGIHYFFFEGRFAWFTRTVVSTGRIEEISISFIGTNPKIIDHFVDAMRHKKSSEELSIYSPPGRMGSRDDWELVKNRRKRGLSTVIMDHAIKDRIVDQITYFMGAEKWYEERGIVHKLSFLFHGQPGTGKSSFIFALASHFNKPAYMVNVNAMDDTGFQRALDKVPKGAFIVFEDIDVSAATQEREPETDAEGNKVVKAKSSKLSMSTILNTLDGIASLNGNVILMTTNHIEHLDPALTRRGRIDHIVKIPLLHDAQIKEYIDMMYPKMNLIQLPQFADMPGCDVQANFLDNKDDFEGFLQQMKTKEN